MLTFLQILDQTNKQCVCEDQCPCQLCDPVASNCTNKTTISKHRCSCPFCAGI